MVFVTIADSGACALEEDSSRMRYGPVALVLGPGGSVAGVRRAAQPFRGASRIRVDALISFSRQRSDWRPRPS